MEAGLYHSVQTGTGKQLRLRLFCLFGLDMLFPASYHVKLLTYRNP